jgi:hypothetical protein
MLRRKFAQESGMILIYTLMFICLGMLIITPLLYYMGSGMKTTHQVYNNKADELYAADSGIVEGQWRIKSDNLKNMPSASGNYTAYDFNTTWTYPLSQTYPVSESPAQVNDHGVVVSIKNEWIPKGITAPAIEKASNIINRCKLVTTGTTDNPITLGSGKKIVKYHIKFAYSKETGENLLVNTVGIWIPSGYKYYSDATYKSSPEVYPSGSTASPTSPPDKWKGNQAVQWTWASPLAFTSIPGATTTGSVVEAEVTFYIEPPQDDPNEKPGAVGWITTSGVDIDGDGNSNGIHYSWNADIKVYKVTSVCGDTTIESYVAKTETRKMQAAISGDYFATGNSLLYDDAGDGYHDTVVNPSYASVSSDNIPPDADIAAAYLYWTGWKYDTATTTILSDSTSSFSPNWDEGINSAWSIDTNTPNSFKGYYSVGKSTNLTLDRYVADLSGTYPSSVFISWDYWYTFLNPVLISPLNPDTCSNYNNWTRAGTSPYSNTAWGADAGNTYFRAHKSGNPATAYYNLTLTNPLSLGAYASGGSVNISWKMWKEGNPNQNDRITLEVSNDNFTSSSSIVTINGNTISATARPAANNYSYAIPTGYLTNTCKLRFKLQNFGGSTYLDIDDITITGGTGPGSGDGVDFTLSADGMNFDTSSLVHAYTGTTMTYGSGAKKNYSYQIPTAYLTTDFRIKLNLIGFSNSNCHISNIRIVAMQADKNCVLSIDGRQVSLDGNGLPQTGGEVTSSRSQIIPNYISGNPDGYSYTSFRDITALVREYSQPYPITDPSANRPGYAQYTVSGVDASYGTHSSDYLIGYAGWSIIFIYTGPSTQGHQLYLYDKFINSGDSTINHSGLIDFNGSDGLISGFVVPNQIKQSVLSISVTNGGSGYTSSPTVNIEGGGGSGAVAMAKVSGGQVTSVSVWNGGSGYTEAPTITFSGGGSSASGATAIATVGDELNAAKITYFVGEGDELYQNDYINMNSTPLWDGTIDTVDEGYPNSKANPKDIFNGTSYGAQFSNGIDIDTLGIDPTANPPQYITWTSGILKAGDTSVQVDMYTHTDVWNLIYVILSFRSTTTTGGDLSYLIH